MCIMHATYTSTNPLEINSVAEFLHITEESAEVLLTRTSMKQREKNLQRFEELKKLEPSPEAIEANILANHPTIYIHMNIPKPEEEKPVDQRRERAIKAFLGS